MKTGLVLEGGGLRGAYTAGALAWFKKEGISFDYSVGISSGAQHLVNFIGGDLEYMEKLAVQVAANELHTGLKPLLKEGQLVGYNHLVDEVLTKQYPVNFETLHASNKQAEIGVYDLSAGKTIWVRVQDLDENYQYLKAASLIPIAGRKVKIDGKYFADAGAEHMIPIKRSIEVGVETHIVITTKPQNYERSETGAMTNFMLALLYYPYKKFRALVKDRRNIYYEQKNLVNTLAKEGLAIELYPSKSFDIGRFGGDRDQLKELFDTGFNDCEARRDEIYAFLNVKED
ncbi:MAG: patatin family protein [Erysipelothrix sp.]|nr:patatin family protein [Erysipelothrix sp.]